MRRIPAPARRAALALAASFAMPALAPAAAQGAPPAAEYSYRFQVVGDGEPLAGTVRARGADARVDVDERGPRDGQGYLLLKDDGRTLAIVRPREREYDWTTTERFTQLVGTTLRALSPVVQIRLRDASVSTHRLGAGERIAGYATERYRIVQRYEVTVGALGFDGGTEYHVVTADYWMHSGFVLARNPLVDLLTTADAALAQKDEAFARRSAAARAALPGTPLRIVVTKREGSGDGDATPAPARRVEISDIRLEPQPASLFRIPDGYREREGLRFDLGW